MRTGRVAILSIGVLSVFMLGYILGNSRKLGIGPYIYESDNRRAEIYTDRECCEERRLQMDERNAGSAGGPRKILLDCGANVASTVNLFRETYPDAHDYIIHSFEIDGGLAPYFAPFSDKGHLLHCPVGVADKNGNMTAYNEGAWFPGKRNNNRDMQWGGGSFFVDKKEKGNKEDGGRRKLSRHDLIPTVDLSMWIQNNVNKNDYVIFKLDVEGAEYGILRKMLKDGTFAWIDKFYGEYHAGQPTGETKEEKSRIRKEVAKQISDVIKWSAETKEYADFEAVNSPKIPNITPGTLGTVINTCGRENGKTMVSVVIEVGMNAKRARKLITTIGAYPIDVPLTLFVYGDFAEENPQLVKVWSKNYEIGIRCDGPMSPGQWEMQNNNALRVSIVSAERRLSDLGLQARYVLPPGLSKTVSNVIQKRQLRIIQPTVDFPPRRTNLTTISHENYHKYRDVERTPKALKVIDDGLKKSGGILSLDSDFPDNYMISVFLLDYLYQTSGHAKIVKLTECLQN